MTTTVIIVILLCVASFFTGLTIANLRKKKDILRLQDQVRLYTEKTEQMSKNYDDYRRKYLDLDDRYQEVKSMEQTYRVAYQEWKNKFETLRSTASDKPKRIEDKASTAASAGDQEDFQILYQSWKKKAKQLEKQKDNQKEEVKQLKASLKKFIHVYSDNQRLKQHLLRLQGDLSAAVSDFDLESSDSLKTPSHMQDVFNLIEDE